MRKIGFKNNQSFFDVCLMADGSLENVFERAIDNDIAITDIQTPGFVLKVDTEPDTVRVTEHYIRRGIEPATLYPIINVGKIKLRKIFDGTIRKISTNELRRIK